MEVISILSLLVALAGAIFVLRRWLTPAAAKAVEEESPLKPKHLKEELNGNTITIIHASLKGTAVEFAQKAAARFNRDGFLVNVSSAAEFDVETLAAQPFVVFIVSTYEGGVAPTAQQPFFTWLTDTADDFRVHKNWNSMRYTVLGLGNRLYCNVGNYCAVAKEVDRCMTTLAATKCTPVYLADERDGLLDPTFDSWITSAAGSAKAWVAGKPAPKDMAKYAGALDEIELTKKSEQEEEDEDEENMETDSEGEGDEGSKNGENASAAKGSGLTDLEDLGQVYGKSTIMSRFRRPDKIDEQGEMLNPRLRAGLSKQGYKLLGSHSGVKLCRWTKAMLRGRGGCYKHSFYGIQSYQCMEMTPSLACANKCVFCWRHHTNPVTREWRWKMDEAKWLLDQATEQHVAMINAMKGVPGVIPERFEEAKRIRHCALSLVGEPIIYPQINEYIKMLHQRGISSFMVTNAQFPDKIEDLEPVTQVYVSIDAATKESLRKIDRPLFTDFWERFLASIDALARKQQRTVFRLTLVKSWNMEEMRDYAALIERGKPEFVEVKGVTYCGESTASDLTMKNVPYHHEVVEFCKALISATPGMSELYDLATEHEHSCCMLIAQKKFFIDGRWHTWIDYDKFHKLANAEPQVPFSTLDYVAETPSWAVYGSKEKGFDPAEVRFNRKKAEPATGGC